MEAEYKNTTKTDKAKQATVEKLATITDNCDNVFALLQAFHVKSSRFIAVPISLRADKRARVWFHP